MSRKLRWTALAALIPLVAFAQSLAAQSPIKQLQLTEKQVVGFLAAHADTKTIAEKMEGDRPDPKIQAALESVAKKHGFKDFNEYDEVAANIALILAGFNPMTKAFTDPPEGIKREIREIEADKTMPANEKKQALDELGEALKSAQSIQFPDNIELVKKYYSGLEKILQ